MTRVLELAIVTVVVCVATTYGQNPPALSEMVRAERTFAARCTEVGIRTSFLEYFADTCVTFEPGPVNGTASLLARPVGAPTSRLRWTPVAGAAARAGDIGYLCGPFVWDDLTEKKRPTRYGSYFSIWRKMESGAFRVVLDVGTPASAPAESLSAEFHAPDHQPLRADSTPADLRTLDEAERELLVAIASPSTSKDVRHFLAPTIRLHRTGRAPATGADSAQFLGGAGTLLGGACSSTDDFGYVWGEYRSLENPNEPSGYYVRIWQRDAGGHWLVIAGVEAPSK